MEEYEATFEVDSKTDALAIERLLNRLYNSIREESRSIREGTADSTATLSNFEAMRDAARERRPGRLTIVYECEDEGFEG